MSNSAWSTGAWVIGVLLIFLFGLGLLVLIFLVAAKPAGTLTVTYEARTSRDVHPPLASEAKQDEVKDASSRLRQLKQLNSEGLITDDDYAERRAAIIDEL